MCRYRRSKSRKEVCIAICEKCCESCGVLKKRIMILRKGIESSCLSPRCPEGYKKVEDIHTQPGNAARPSETDKNGVKRGTRNYIITGYVSRCPHIIRLVKYGQHGGTGSKYYDCDRKKWVEKPNNNDENCDGVVDEKDKKKQMFWAGVFFANSSVSVLRANT